MYSICTLQPPFLAYHPTPLPGPSYIVPQSLQLNHEEACSYAHALLEHACQDMHARDRNLDLVVTEYLTNNEGERQGSIVTSSQVVFFMHFTNHEEHNLKLTLIGNNKYISNHDFQPSFSDLHDSRNTY